MDARRTQGLAFCVGAVLVAAVSLTGALSPAGGVRFSSVLILFLGVPHGALDTLFARSRYRLSSVGGWLLFVAAYLALAALVVGVWVVAPACFLTGFLVISLVHFSGDPATGTPVAARVVYGGTILVLPLLLHRETVVAMLSAFAGPDAVLEVTPTLARLAWPWLVAVVLLVVLGARRDREARTELAALALLAVLAPPLVAFTVFFCAMHSARHILTTVGMFRSASRTELVLALTAPMCGILVLTAAAWLRLGNVPVDARALQIAFVGMAALTVPHMLLVDRLRLESCAQTDLVAIQSRPRIEGVCR